ncbi:MAG TPA: multicopper oxidase domain-containing protein [Terriglobales bacterium]|nr:multicopper oxidase domain-containing protein [Terriglobales bacterium]
MLPGKRTAIWGYEGMFPGPTIKVLRGRRTTVRHINRLGIPTVVHLHGGPTPSESDGFPVDRVMPGTEKTYFYPNDRAATLWYHDHAIDHTGRNIFMGLAGLYIVESEHEQNLPLPKDGYDVPLILQDRLFSADGALLYEPDSVDGPNTDTILVNGAPWPKMEVSACRYRFRLLNASNARSFHLALSSGNPFVQIATDGGLFERPRPLQDIPLAMAERVEVIVDFSAYLVNTQITLDDLNQPLATRSILRFDVVRKIKDDTYIPERLVETSETVNDRSAPHRTFVFTRGNSVKTEARWSINGEEFDPARAITEVKLGDTEVWRLANHSFREKHNVVHPIHIHLMNFQILQRNGGPPLPHEVGLKDTVALNVGDEVVVGMRVAGFRGRYLFHCHNLEHEDRGMMARFDVL